MLCTLIFQSLCGYQWNTDILNAIYKSNESNNLWANYRIARAAVRYGHHEIALNIFNGLTEEVSSENLHFWLLCLKEMCAAEAKLVDNGNGGLLIDKLDFAVTHYNRAIAALKVNKLYCKLLNYLLKEGYCRLQALHLIICNSKPNTCESELNFFNV